jgi:5-methyltetrahydropteroyltriglutamate--homocysteine methyltransferase
VVRKQSEAGIDIVNDGEMSKPSYATYVKDRLDGFGGSGNTFVYQDLADFPNLAKRVFGDPGRSRRKTPACNAPIRVRDARAAADDVENLQAALTSVNVAEAFMSAASPGVVSLFFRNDHTRTTRPTCSRSPRRCGTNTRPSRAPASCCRSIVPTSPWAGISSTPT